MNIPRIAFFTDSFHEVNGVALTSREFARYAQNQAYPFLSVHRGPQTRYWPDGPFETFELKNSPFVLALDTNLSFDLLFARHLGRLRRRLEQFQPDLIHVTGPGHCGLLGALLAHRLGIPLAASWHTNLHEFAGRRLARLLPFVSPSARDAACRVAERWSLTITVQFYRLASLLFAPNPELVEMLETRTRRPTHLMLRGIDTALFSPHKRDRADSNFVVGYVGRLSPEKNVRLLAEIENAMLEVGIRDYRFLVVGDGSQRQWLADNLRQRELPGTLRGEELARAYANMDAFVFPSETDTFGNVVLEAMSSGVPALVASAGGPKFIVESGVSGYAVAGANEFAASVLRLYRNPEKRMQMAQAARQRALSFSWSAVFEGVYQQYWQAFASGSLHRVGRALSADARN